MHENTSFNIIFDCFYWAAYFDGLISLAADVKITPLGSQAGEFCQLDHAMPFEDPDGTRILYDPGRTVAGADDPRLDSIDVILVNHPKNCQLVRFGASRKARGATITTVPAVHSNGISGHMIGGDLIQPLGYDNIPD
jgi:hypothetical protein